MEEQPSFKPPASGTNISRRETITDVPRQLGRVLVISLVGAALYALVVGPRNFTGISDGLFIAGALWLVIGLMPVFGDIFGRATVTFDSTDRTLKDVLQQRRERGKQDDSNSLVYGTGGVIMMVLSLIIGFALN